MKDFIKKFIELAEDNEWSVEYEEEDNILELSKYSPNGQDFFVRIKAGETLEDIAENLYDYAENYDADYEAYLWIGEDGHGKNGAPYRIKDIVTDMEECQAFIYELSEIISAEDKKG